MKDNNLSHFGWVKIFEMPWALMQAVCIVLSIPYSLRIANAAVPITSLLAVWPRLKLSF